MPKKACRSTTLAVSRRGEINSNCLFASRIICSALSSHPPARAVRVCVRLGPGCRCLPGRPAAWRPVAWPAAARSHARAPRAAAPPPCASAPANAAATKGRLTGRALACGRVARRGQRVRGGLRRRPRLRGGGPRLRLRRAALLGRRPRGITAVAGLRCRKQKDSRPAESAISIKLKHDSYPSNLIGFIWPQLRLMIMMPVCAPRPPL